MKTKPTPQQKFSIELATVRQPKRICTESWWARPWPDHAAFHAVWTQQLTRWGWTTSDAHLWRKS